MAKRVYPAPQNTVEILVQCFDDGMTWTNTFYCPSVSTPLMFEKFVTQTKDKLRAIYNVTTLISNYDAGGGKVVTKPNGDTVFERDGIWSDTRWIEEFGTVEFEPQHLPRHDVLAAKLDGNDTKSVTMHFPVRIPSASMLYGKFSTDYYTLLSSQVSALLSDTDYVLGNRNGYPYDQMVLDHIPGIDRDLHR